MPVSAFKDIQINARQESFRMLHYYIGVEHFVIGMLEVQGGLLASALDEQGISPKYAIDAIRKKVGKGNRQRSFAGMPNSPRADMVYTIASDIALAEERTDITERDLIFAILEEGDSIALRVLLHLGVDRQRLETHVRSAREGDIFAAGHIRVHFSDRFQADTSQALESDHLAILRRMFANYAEIRIERRLSGGYTTAVVVIVTPIHPGGIEDAPIVVKIDDEATITEEAKRYETLVKGALPPLTARLEERPVLVDFCDLAGIKYTFVYDEANGQEQTLRDMATAMENFGDWLANEFYPNFGKSWWNQSRPYRFQVWTEYDWLLPPLLTLDYIGTETTEDGVILRPPFRRERAETIDYGDMVILENFTVQKIDRAGGTLALSIGQGTEAARRAYRVKIRGVDHNSVSYFRGELIDRIVGRVWERRDTQLFNALLALDPDFDISGTVIPGIPTPLTSPPLLNPIKAYTALLDIEVNGSASTIHGDLHLGNILLGPHQSAFLIDFAHTRSGHTLFDWATLELSILNDLAIGLLGSTWDDARMVAYAVANLDSPLAAYPQLNAIIDSIRALRGIVAKHLATPNAWNEYSIALLFNALRAMTWETLSIGGRRLMVYIAAWQITRLKDQRGVDAALNTSDTDDGVPTDFTGNR